MLIGASAGGVFTMEMIRAMNRFPVVFALATPEPEIRYEDARAARQDVIVATGLGPDPNAVLDVLSFPYIFRGALDVQSVSISEGMMLAAARALADLAREEVPEEVELAYGGGRLVFGPEYLLPKPIDPASSCASRRRWPPRRWPRAWPPSRWSPPNTRGACRCGWAPAARRCAS